MTFNGFNVLSIEKTIHPDLLDRIKQGATLPLTIHVRLQGNNLSSTD